MIERILYDEIKIITIFSFILDYKITNYKLQITLRSWGNVGEGEERIVSNKLIV